MSHAPSAALARRHDTIRRALDEHRLDALVITALPNILYLTNFTGSSAIVVVSADRLRFLTDSRYLTVIDETRGQGYECPDLELVAVEGSYDAKLAEVLDGQSWTRVGFEATDLTVARHTWLTKTVAIELVATEGVVERARVVKDDYEIATL